MKAVAILLFASIAVLAVAVILRARVKVYVERNHPEVWQGFVDPQAVGSLFTPLDQSTRFMNFLAERRYLTLGDQELNRRVAWWRAATFAYLAAGGLALLLLAAKFLPFSH